MTTIIDICAVYTVTLMNGCKIDIAGRAFLQCYLRNPLNRPQVKTYERKEGCWYDVKFDGVNQWTVYAINVDEAIQARMDDLIALNMADPLKLSAIRSGFNDRFEVIDA